MTEIFEVTGLGTILKVEIQSGIVFRGQQLRLRPARPDAGPEVVVTIRQISRSRTFLESAGPGQPVGLLLQDALFPYRGRHLFGGPGNAYGQSTLTSDGE
ncbi:MAG: hypothetical protein ACYDFT_06265 [Thermoplasmata archaeon]